MSDTVDHKHKLDIIKKSHRSLSEKISKTKDLINTSSNCNSNTQQDITSEFVELLDTKHNKCNICIKKFKSAEDAQDHMKKNHSDNLPYNEVLPSVKRQLAKRNILRGSFKTGVKAVDDAVLPENNQNKKRRQRLEPICNFVTINPPECDVYTIKKIIDVMTKSYFLNIICYVFEQRGDSNVNVGCGKHIHMIVDNCEYPSILSRSIFGFLTNKCKKYSFLETSKSIFVEHIYDMQQFNKVVDYMKGNKPHIKLSTVKMNTHWRLKNNLMDFYNMDKNNKFIHNDNIIDSPIIKYIYPSDVVFTVANGVYECSCVIDGKKIIWGVKNESMVQC